MDFYQELSRYYDEIFAASAAEMSFINQNIPQGAAVLDIGCGTGNKTVHLASRAAFIDAIDLDEGMIAKAGLDNARPNIRYAALDMNEINKDFAGKRFDAVLCLGNTLVHLLSPEAIGDFLGKTRALLTPNGAFIMQILNYDRIITQNVTDLPLIDTPHVRFLRRYDWKDGEMHFVTAIEIKSTGERLVNDIPLYPLRKAELENLLAGAGFGQVELFGSYQGAPLNEDSFLVMAVCR